MNKALAVVTAVLLTATAMSAPLDSQAPAAGATVYEGARVIVGDGSAPIENAAFVVEGARITQVGRAGQVKAPAGAARVDLAGKTVMPAIIDTHTHMGDTREAVVALLQRKAYFGVGAVLSLGTDPGDIAFKLRDERIPTAPGC
jgi:imidazolonepropionase-like amidohydrolase